MTRRTDRRAGLAEGASAALGLFLLCLAWSRPTPAQTTCAECHDDTAGVADSVHGFLDCTDCHDGFDAFPHPEPAGRADCSACHDEVVEQYQGSAHGLARQAGSPDAPGCEACHGTIHALVAGSDPRSPVHPQNLAETCGSCHADPQVVAKYGIPVALPLEAYRQSVHGRSNEAGREGASCSSCHGSHALYSAADPRSGVNHQRVAETCGQCHAEHTKAYRASVHGKAATHGAREAPSCTDCHGEHRILSPRERGSPVFATNIPKMTCGRCHGDLRLAEKFGIAEGPVPSYRDSYHGLASRAGGVTVAHCGSCHGVHDILPSSDPASHVHKDNLAATCGKCHPGAGRRFAIGSVHVNRMEREHAAVFYARGIYLWLIYLTIGGMILHNLLDLLRKLRHPPVRPNPGSVVRAERMSRGFRIAHALMMLSFVVLVYTGFALTYPEAWWARPLLRWESAFGLRGGLHRGAALVMLGALAFHLVHLVVDRRARACIAGMRPGLHDVHELVERVRYFLGRRAHPPRAGRLGYPEKLEYIALMWGLAIMTLTGFALWMDNLMLSWFPKWVSDVATVIHFYEAVLASLAILVWHLYFVIFDPLVYPMDTAWLSGLEPPGRVEERREADAGVAPQQAVAQAPAKRKQRGATG